LWKIGGLVLLLAGVVGHLALGRMIDQGLGIGIQRTALRLRDRLADFDVVHSHLDFMALPFRRPNDPPMVTTLHGRLDLPEFFPIYDAFRAEHFVSISNAQRLPVPLLDWVATVYHGLPVTEYDRASTGAQAYWKVAMELVDRR
jgi:hypothetical protein